MQSGHQSLRAMSEEYFSITRIVIYCRSISGWWRCHAACCRPMPYSER